MSWKMHTYIPLHVSTINAWNVCKYVELNNAYKTLDDNMVQTQ